MKVVHVAITPLSGSPVRIVRALNRHTSIEANLVTLKPKFGTQQIFESEWVWSEQREEALEHMEQADCLHLHNFNRLSDFDPVLKTLPSLKRKPKLAQFHGCPEPIQYERDEGMPELVIAQYPERHFPYARIVPNILGIDDACYRPGRAQENDGGVRVFFAPSMPFSAWKVPERLGRWATKGQLEVDRCLKRLELRSRGNMTRVFCTQVPHAMCMQAKQQCQVAIDDVVTGSYHLASLESLSQGLATIAYLDGRTQALLKELTGAEMLPWLNCRLEDLNGALSRLIEDSAYVGYLGAVSRAWMENYYNDATLVAHYERAYRDLLEDPRRISKKRFGLEEKKTSWVVQRAFDVQYRARVPRGKSMMCESAGVEFAKEASFGRPHSHKSPVDAWLYAERGRRLDGGSDFFAARRKSFMHAKYAFAASFIKGKSVLHLGCGTGYGTAILKNEGEPTSILGIDADRLAVTYGKTVRPEIASSLTCGDALSKDINSNVYDAIIAIGLLEQVDCDDALLEACAQMLRPGGDFIISCGDFWDESMEAWQNRCYNEHAAQNILEDCFSHVRTYRQVPVYDSAKFDIIPESPQRAPLRAEEALIFTCRL